MTTRVLALRGFCLSFVGRMGSRPAGLDLRGQEGRASTWVLAQAPRRPWQVSPGALLVLSALAGGAGWTLVPRGQAAAAQRTQGPGLAAAHPGLMERGFVQWKCLRAPVTPSLFPCTSPAELGSKVCFFSN